MRRHALLLLGMHRSGTSALTGTIASARAHPGTNLMPPTADSPECYWGDAPLVGFNGALLKSLARAGTERRWPRPVEQHGDDERRNGQRGVANRRGI